MCTSLFFFKILQLLSHSFDLSPLFPITNLCYTNTGSGTRILHVFTTFIQLTIPASTEANYATESYSLNNPFWQHTNYIQTTRQSQLNLNCFQNLVLILTSFGSPRHSIYKIHGRILAAWSSLEINEISLSCPYPCTCVTIPNRHRWWHSYSCSLIIDTDDALVFL